MLRARLRRPRVGRFPPRARPSRAGCGARWSRRPEPGGGAQWNSVSQSRGRRLSVPGLSRDAPTGTQATQAGPSGTARRGGDNSLPAPSPAMMREPMSPAPTSRTFSFSHSSILPTGNEPFRHPSPVRRRFECKEDETILAAALNNGVGLPYGCRNGACGSCRARITAGSVDYGKYVPAVLSDADRAKGYALLCAAPARPPTWIVEAREVVGGADVQVKILPRACSPSRRWPTTWW